MHAMILPRIFLHLAVVVLVGGQAPLERNFTECAECPEMVAIPAGKFLMGSPAREAGRFVYQGPHHVVTKKAFSLGK